MQKVKLENEKLEITVNIHGAELSSIREKKNDTQYLWNADPKYWNRSSPVLFPFVGGVKDKVYRHEGVEYPMNQHGFARDMDFDLLSHTENEVWFALDATEETKKVYPFDFHLEIGYHLEENAVKVMWKVKNTNDKTMYFSIGAHPAFFCPVREGEKQSDDYIAFRKADGTVPESFTNTIFGQGGMVTTEKKKYGLQEGILPITENLFDGDALVIENHQVQRVALMDSDKKEYLAVEFNAPLVGIWSPPKKHAPFVCIEPWYGRCDSEVFDGELKDREWGNTLEAGETFEAEYRVVVLA